MTPTRLARSLKYQIDHLLFLARVAKTTIVAVKPHGALYHDVRSSIYHAEILLTTVEYTVESNPGLQYALVGPVDGVLKKLAQERHCSYLDEGFADRNYLPNGALVPRSEPGALIEDPREAARQAVRLAQSGSFDTLCVHGDSPNALEMARAVRRALEDAHLLEGV
jgi:UPF0271 protein